MCDRKYLFKSEERGGKSLTSVQINPGCTIFITCGCVHTSSPLRNPCKNRRFINHRVAYVCLIATFSMGLDHLSAGLEATQYRVVLNERETCIMVELYLLVWFEYTTQRVIAHSRINEIMTLEFPGGILRYHYQVSVTCIILFNIHVTMQSQSRAQSDFIKLCEEQ